MLVGSLSFRKVLLLLRVHRKVGPLILVRADRLHEFWAHHKTIDGFHIPAIGRQLVLRSQVEHSCFVRLTGISATC